MEEKKVTILGNIYGFKGGNYAGTVFDKQGISPCINTCGGGNREPMVVVKEKNET